MAADAAAEAGHVVATAGHVDHGKSSLIRRLTGIDPDRWEEEKRRGLTIDLGFAWAVLPSGREIGFVDVPGHERFVRNMLAGVGPVRLIVFVVAADEGWKPQSEEHLEIVDVLGAAGGVVALTKGDLVGLEALAETQRKVRERLGGTALERAPIVVCSSVTGAGIDELAHALDAMVASAPPPEDRGRPRLPIDRSFTIHGAGTVVTGTLTGGTLRTGDEMTVYPDGRVVRVRGLQTHRRSVAAARPVSRVAVNLAGIAKSEVERGDVLAAPGHWRPTSVLEGRITGVRSLGHGVAARGAFKLYVGTAERDARLRLYGRAELRARESAFARLTLTRPVAVETGDRFVLREAGRRETVAGGVVLDAHPPARPADPKERLARRERAGRDGIAALVVEERRAIRTAELEVLAGGRLEAVDRAVRVGSWWVARGAMEDVERSVVEVLGEYHAAHPLRPGLDAAEVRRALLDRTDPVLSPLLEQGLSTELVAALERSGRIARDGTLLRLAEHRVRLEARDAEARRLLDEVASAEPSPPTVAELVASGHAPDLIEASIGAGRLVRVSPEIVVTAELASRAEALARREAASPDGLTVSRFRELLGTTRKYALPLLEWLDARGVTRRDGDVRRPA